MLDLERFQSLNAALGYAVGDRVLQEVARRLARFVGPLDTAARFGSDEFFVLLARPDAASALAEVGRIHPGAVSAAEFSILADAADWTVAHNRTMVAFRRSSLVADRHTTRSELF